MLIHPYKSDANKSNIYNIKKIGFIYPIEYTTWMSNPIHVLKNQGTIRACTKFCDLKKSFPKGNFPTPLIKKIIDECMGHEIISFMDVLFGYN